MAHFVYNIIQIIPNKETNGRIKRIYKNDLKK